MARTPNHAIRIRILDTRFLNEESDPEDERFVFTYTVRLSNRGTLPAQLMRRHLIITHANGNTQNLIADGIVGEQPRLEPGQAFEYTSGVVLETSVGTLHGDLLWETDDGKPFKSPIPQFTLSIPRTLH